MSDLSRSILQSIKKQNNIEPESTEFDDEIILLINSAFGVLNQLGVGPEAGYSIDDENNVWDEFYSDSRLDGVREYVYLSVKLSFDPPSSGFVTSALSERLKELSWRLAVAMHDINEEKEHE